MVVRCSMSLSSQASQPGHWCHQPYVRRSHTDAGQHRLIFDQERAPTILTSLKMARNTLTCPVPINEPIRPTSSGRRATEGGGQKTFAFIQLADNLIENSPLLSLTHSVQLCDMIFRAGTRIRRYLLLEAQLDEGNRCHFFAIWLYPRPCGYQ